MLSIRIDADTALSAKELTAYLAPSLHTLDRTCLIGFSRFCQLHQKPVDVYGVDAPLDDAVAELRQGKEREALFGLAHSYVSFGSHLYRLLLVPFYRIAAGPSRMRSDSAHPDVFLR